MGNYASCALASPNGRSSKSKATKVIFPTGEIKQLNQPTKAAELMLETPNYFLVNSISLKIGKRFSALNADEDLEMGCVYVMFPMQRVNSFVNTADMGAIFLAAKRGSGQVRVVPACSAEEKDERTAEREGLLELCSPELVRRRSVCRSKRPLLETIVEEPVCLR